MDTYRNLSGHLTRYTEQSTISKKNLKNKQRERKHNIGKRIYYIDGKWDFVNQFNFDMLKSFSRVVRYTFSPTQPHVGLSSCSSRCSRTTSGRSSIGYPSCLVQYLHILIQSLFFSSVGRAF